MRNRGEKSGWRISVSFISVALRLSQEQEAARQRRLREEEEEMMRQVLELSLREK